MKAPLPQRSAARRPAPAPRIPVTNPKPVLAVEAPLAVFEPVTPVTGSCPNVVLPPKPLTLPWVGNPPLSLQAVAVKVLAYPMGTIGQSIVDGAPVVLQCCCHFSWGANPQKADSWHKGVTAFRLAEEVDGELVAVTTPPAGWPQSPPPPDRTAPPASAVGAPVTAGALMPTSAATRRFGRGAPVPPAAPTAPDAPPASETSTTPRTDGGKSDAK